MKKQVLSLALAIALALSLILPAGAAFTDSADVKYTEAVDVMTGIGAISGYTDNTIKPGATITREEAAKLVCYSIIGKDAAEKLTVGTTGFSDVDTGRWSAPFISYLVGKGVIAGMGDGTFAPAAVVTGYQFAKMMLCAAGYGAKDEFTGAGWELAVDIAANKTGIFAGAVGVDYTKAATRQEAMLYAFNGIANISTVTGGKTAVVYNPTGNTLGKLNIDLSKTVSGDTHVWTMGSKPITVSFVNKPVDMKSQIACSTLLVQDGVATANTQYGFITAKVAKSAKLTITGPDFTADRTLSDDSAYIFAADDQVSATFNISTTGELASVAVAAKKSQPVSSNSDFWVYAGESTNGNKTFYSRSDTMHLKEISDKSQVTTPSVNSIYHVSNNVLSLPEYQLSGQPANAGSTGMTINGTAVTFSDKTVFMDISSAAPYGWTGSTADAVNVMSYYNIAYHKENGVNVADMVCRTGAVPVFVPPVEESAPVLD